MFAMALRPLLVKMRRPRNGLLNTTISEEDVDSRHASKVVAGEDPNRVGWFVDTAASRALLVRPRSLNN